MHNTWTWILPFLSRMGGGWWRIINNPERPLFCLIMSFKVSNFKIKMKISWFFFINTWKLIKILKLNQIKKLKLEGLDDYCQCPPPTKLSYLFINHTTFICMYSNVDVHDFVYGCPLLRSSKTFYNAVKCFTWSRKCS